MASMDMPGKIRIQFPRYFPNWIIVFTSTQFDQFCFGVFYYKRLPKVIQFDNDNQGNFVRQYFSIICSKLGLPKWYESNLIMVSLYNCIFLHFPVIFTDSNSIFRQSKFINRLIVIVFIFWPIA